MVFLSKCRNMFCLMSLLLITCFIHAMEKKEMVDDEREGVFAEIKELLQTLRKERMRLEELYWAGHEKINDYNYTLSCARRFELSEKASGIVYQFLRGLSFFHQSQEVHDYAEALSIFTVVANQTISPEMHAAANFYLGLMYFHGRGAPQSNKVAQKYFEQVKNNTYSNFGRAASHYYLGRIYEQTILQLQGSEKTEALSNLSTEDEAKRTLMLYYTKDFPKDSNAKLLTYNGGADNDITTQANQDLALLMQGNSDDRTKIDNSDPRLDQLLLLLKRHSSRQQTSSPTIEIPDEDEEVNAPVALSLHEASAIGNLTIVRDYIKKRANLNPLDSNGDTPLHLACFNGHLALAQALCTQKVNTKLINKNGDTAFHVACNSGKMPLVELLLSEGVERERPNKAENRPLHIASLKGHSELVRLLLAHGCEKEQKNNEQKTPLLCAWQAKSAKTMAVLLEYGALLINDVSGDSLFMAACKEGNQEAMHVILRAVPNAELLLNTTFFDACTAGNNSVIEILLQQGVNVDVCNSGGLSGMQLALASKKEKAIIALLMHKAKSSINLQEWACTNGCLELLKFFCATNVLSLEEGCQLLNSGCIHCIIVQYLLSKLHQNGITDSALLFEACKKGYLTVLQALRKLNVSLDVLDEDGNTLLHCATHKPIIQFLKKDGDPMNNGYNRQAKNKKGWTAFENACATGNTEMVKACTNEWTAQSFWLAVQEGQMQIADLLTGYNHNDYRSLPYMRGVIITPPQTKERAEAKIIIAAADNVVRDIEPQVGTYYEQLDHRERNGRLLYYLLSSKNDYTKALISIIQTGRSLRFCGSAHDDHLYPQDYKKILEVAKKNQNAAVIQCILDNKRAL